MRLLAKVTTYVASLLTIDVSGIATTSTDGLVVQNSTPATAGVPVRYSPRLRLSGTGWKTDATAASQTIDVAQEVQPVSAGAAPTFFYTWKQSIAGGAFADFLRYDATGGPGSGHLAVKGNALNNTAYFTSADALGSGLGFPSGLPCLIYAGIVAAGVNGFGNFFINGGTSLDFGTAGVLSNGSLTVDNAIIRAGAQQLNFQDTNPTPSKGIGINFATDGTLKIRTRAQTADGTLTALDLQASGAVSGSRAPAASATVPTNGSSVINRKLLVASGQKLTIASSGAMRIL